MQGREEAKERRQERKCKRARKKDAEETMRVERRVYQAKSQDYPANPFHSQRSAHVSRLSSLVTSLPVGVFEWLRNRHACWAR